jgi:hypothetical protein
MTGPSASVPKEFLHRLHRFMCSAIHVNGLDTSEVIELEKRLVAYVTRPAAAPTPREPTPGIEADHSKRKTAFWNQRGERCLCLRCSGLPDSPSYSLQQAAESGCDGDTAEMSWAEWFDVLIFKAMRSGMVSGAERSEREESLVQTRRKIEAKISVLESEVARLTRELEVREGITRNWKTRAQNAESENARLLNELAEKRWCRNCGSFDIASPTPAAPGGES